MEELDDMRERLKKNRLPFTWLIYQLSVRGLKTDKSEISSIFAGTRKGAKADSIIRETKIILDNYEKGRVLVMFSISQICSGMAKIKLLPSVFLRKNKRGTPYVGLFLVTVAMILINATGLSTSDQLTFLILTGCTFWIFSYIILHLDVLVLRKRLPKAPRTFKLPFGPVIPILGIIGNAFMIYNIDPSWEVKKKIYLIFVIVLAVLSVYAVVWIKVVIKRPLFRSFQIKEVMAMESDLYQMHHNPSLAKRLHIHAEPELQSMPADFNTGTRPE